ncbi:ElyC/SanA/YdcF family protein [Streptomyces sp. H10-C2]|uniref:SanA/YdcF family protein n=1 Tax=unclassified Streptomyces TaxID=2593676 RepID=UPI0024B8B0A3|nr:MULTISPECIES: ElyC/SanA/YdcF family protein [unclassified Streptomyces]MDJ0344648.1 ElyC/SanA/YdcF family protein [Streptomyces sp. PH10-H1]MDJ0373192.1 ElyC/SanA/YdcF family protein [Streptomyces sp. H10-C2]
MEPGRIRAAVPAALRRLRPPRTRRGWRRLLRGAMICSVLALLPAGWLQVSADSRVRAGADVPAEPVAVVFGAGLADGKPTPYLAHRLDAGAELYRAHKVRAILVTGDNSRTGYNEPGAMLRYLEKKGVPASKVVLDYAGFDTWDSCSRAKRIFGVNRAILVSQGFHIRRALALCDAAGVEGYGVGVDEPHDATWFYGGAREVIAASKAALNAAVKPDPAFLGPREPGVTRALTGDPAAR